MTALRRVWVGAPLAALAASAWLWERIPDPMPIHWDLWGQPGAWTPRAIGLLLLPLSSLAIAGGIALVTGRAALSAKNALARDRLVASTSLFLAAMHGLVLDAALRDDHQLTIGAVAALLGAMSIALGLTIPATEPNPWLGVRTRATLGDPAIWALVNRLGGRALVVTGAASIVAALTLPAPAALIAAILSLVVATIAPIVYAWMLGRARRR